MPVKVSERLVMELGEIKSKLIKAVKAWLIPFDGDPGDERLRSPDQSTTAVTSLFQTINTPEMDECTAAEWR